MVLNFAAKLSSAFRKLLEWKVIRRAFEINRSFFH